MQRKEHTKNEEYLENMNIMEQKEWMQNFAEKSKARLYLNWRNSKGNDCKMIGPETKCFCNHRFKEHNYQQSSSKKVNCKNPKCPCLGFYYIPTHGAYDFKCLCKHSYKEHDPMTRKCKRASCACPNRFSSTWTCSCGLKFAEHVTVVQTYEERKQAGRQVGDIARMIDDLGQPEVKGGLMDLDSSTEKPSFRSVRKQPSVLTKPNVKAPTPSKQDEQRKRKQLQKLNNRLQKQLDDEPQREEISEQIEQPEVEGDTPALELYMRPHNYRKVTMDVRRLRM